MYDIILRDATIVTSQGRVVADVAVQDGRIAYVGPRPPKSRTREELSAMGRFLIPGVIDTGVSFMPDGDPAVWMRESLAAVSGGVTTVIAHAGGDRPVVDSASARARHARIGEATWTHYALWGEATGDNAASLAAACAERLLVGATATVSRADGGLTATKVPAYLDQPGVLGLQLGALLDDPESLRALADVVGLRPVHLLNLSSAEELQLLDPVHGESRFTAGVTPQHLFFSDADAAPLQGITPVPPPRPETDRRSLWAAVKRGRLDCLASDHAPSVPGNGARGVPAAELLLPLLLSATQNGRLTLEQLVALCCEAPARIFGLTTKGKVEKGYDADLVLFSEGQSGRVHADALLSGAGWSPYADREIAPKPDVVIVGGRIVARRGFVIADAPNGRHALPAP